MSREEPAPAPARPRVAITLCTYHRPRGLERALRSLSRLELPRETDVELFVIDNAPDGNARSVVERMRPVLAYEVRYRNELTPGISAARNRALDEAVAEGFDFMVSVDDDMHVEPGWLAELLAVATESGAAAVIGRREYEHDGSMSWWVNGAHRLDYRPPDDRAPLEQGHTGGALVRLDPVRALGLRFEESLGKSGGEDTLFFDRIIRTGGRILYAKRALSHEVLGPDRLRIRWWLRRWYRTGNTSGMVSLVAGRRRVRVLADGLIRIALGLGGTLAALPWLLRRRTRGMRTVRMVCRGCGYVAAAFGLRYEEYASDKRGE